LVISHENDADTKFALKVKGKIPRYFDNLTIKTNSVGKSEKIGFATVKYIDLFMA